MENKCGDPGPGHSASRTGNPGDKFDRAGDAQQLQESVKNGNFLSEENRDFIFAVVGE